MSTRSKAKAPRGKRKPAIPSWPYPHMMAFLEHSDEVRQLLRLCRFGIAALDFVPHALEVVADEAEKSGRQLPSNFGKKIEGYHELARLAKTEVAKGYPLLHRQALVTIWAALESHVRSFVALWVEHEPEILKEKAFSTLKVNLGEYMAMPPSDQARYVVDLLEQNVGSSRKPGIERFEALLAAFGMSGPVDKELAKTLRELQQIRNVVVHRSGVADRRLIEQCPWLGLKVGMPLQITAKDASRYHLAVMEYARILVDRYATKLGLPQAPDEDAA